MFANRSIFDMMLKELEPTPIDSSQCDLNPIEPIPLSSASYEGTTDGFEDLFDVVNQVLELSDPENLPHVEIPSQPTSWLTTNSIQKSNIFLPNSVLSKQTNLTGRNAGIDSTPSGTSFSQHQSGKWNERYQELRQFQQVHDHCSVPSHWPQNPPLAQWVKRQRYQYKLNNEGHYSTMTEERQKLLEELGFVWDSHSTFWEERLNELHTFREKHGHCNVLTKYPENPQLAIWAKCQRRQFKLFCTEGAKRSNMTLERISKLSRIGFVFNPRELKRRMAPRCA
jgi:hypothetical protein